MKVIDDSFIFDDGDIAQLSPGLQKALQNFFGTNLDDSGNFLVPASSALSAALDDVLASAKRYASKQQLEVLIDLASALAVADDSTKASVQVFLDQASVAAGISPKPQPGPVFEAPPEPIKQTPTLTAIKR